MAASKQNVNYDLKEVARTTDESLIESVANVTEIIETISNLETRACKIPIFSKSRDWDYPDFKFSIPGLVFRD